MVTEIEVTPYPKYRDDPEPPPHSSQKTAIQASNKEVKDCTSQVYQAYVRSKLRDETLLCDLTTIFAQRPCTLGTSQLLSSWWTF